MEDEENELVVVADAEFEWLLSRPGIEWGENGTLLMRTDGLKKTFIRQRDWEKKQEPFGAEARAGRERIEKARRLRYKETDSIEPQLRLHEYGLLRNANSTELESYVAAEATITVCQLKQREIIKLAGIRGKVWKDEESAEAFLHGRLDNSSYEFHKNWPDWETIQEALDDVETPWLDALYAEIQAAEITQIEISRIVSARYVDSHPKEYPNG